MSLSSQENHRVVSSTTFAEVVSNWRSDPHNPIEMVLEPAIESQLQIQDGVICDFGCGLGAVRRGLSPHVLYIGVDLNQELLSRAADLDILPNQFFLRGNIGGSAPLTTCSADRIICSLVAPHLDDEEARKLINEMYRSLKPEGFALISIISQSWAAQKLPIDEIEDVIELRKSKLGIEYLEWHRSAKWYTQALKDAGFIDVALQSITIPENPELEERYFSNHGKELFVLIKARK